MEIILASRQAVAHDCVVSGCLLSRYHWPRLDESGPASTLGAIGLAGSAEVDGPQGSARNQESGLALSGTVRGSTVGPLSLTLAAQCTWAAALNSSPEIRCRRLAGMEGLQKHFPQTRSVRDLSENRPEGRALQKPSQKESMSLRAHAGVASLWPGQPLKGNAGAALKNCRGRTLFSSVLLHAPVVPKIAVRTEWRLAGAFASFTSAWRATNAKTRATQTESARSEAA